MIGDRTLFTTAEGVERLWEISAPLLEQPVAAAVLRAGLVGARRDRRPDRAAPLAPAVRAQVEGLPADLSARVWFAHAPIALVSGCPALPRRDRAVPRGRAACARPLRRQQLGRHGRRRRPELVPAARAHQHRARQGASGSRRSRPSPDRAGLLPRHPQAGRRGPRPVRRRHVLLARRALPLRLAAELRRRRRLRPAHAQDRLARAGRGLPRRPHGDLARRRALARLGLDRAQGPRHRHRARARSPASSRPATSRTRTTTRADGTADLPRLDRHGLHADRRPGARRHQGRALASRSSTRARCGCSSASTWARSSRRPAIRT